MNKQATKTLTIALAVTILLSSIGLTYSVNLAPASKCEEGKIDWSINKEGETKEVRVYNFGEQEMKYEVKLSGTGAQFAEITSDKYFTLTPENNKEEVKIHIEPTTNYTENKTYNLEVKPSFWIKAEGSVQKLAINSCYNIKFTGNRTTPLPKINNHENPENSSAPEKLDVTQEEKQNLPINLIAIALIIVILSLVANYYWYNKKEEEVDEEIVNQLLGEDNE